VLPNCSHSSTLNGESQQDGGGPQLAPLVSKTGCKAYAMPSPRYFVQRLACCPCSFCFFLPTCLPCSRSCANCLLIRLRSQQDRAALSLCLSSFPSLSILPALFTPSAMLSRRYQCRRRSPRRIFSSELVRRVLTSTRRSSMALKSRNPFNPRPRRTTRMPWIYGRGKSTSLRPCSFSKRLTYLTLQTT